MKHFFLIFCLLFLSACGETQGLKEKGNTSELSHESKEIPVSSIKEPMISLWMGEWKKEESQHEHSSLLITDETLDSFSFTLTVTSGAHSGLIQGVATLQNGEGIYLNNGCELRFHLIESKVNVKSTDACSSYTGVGTTFSGEFVKSEVAVTKKNSLYDMGVFIHEEDDQTFRNLVGNDYELFSERFQILSEVEDMDNFSAKVVAGAVRGLFTIMEGIIMYNSDNEYWAAVIDGGVVKYYTNVPEYKNKLPKTFDEWRSRFTDLNVQYMSQELNQ